jgi:hypothetical protein
MGNGTQPGDSEAKALTSWSEIANYLGKGVRTVQRWEQELGLPIRRSSGAPKHAVLALPHELDKWLHESMALRAGDDAGHDGNARTGTPNAHATSQAATIESVRQRAVELAGHAQRLSLRSAELSLSAAELLRRSGRIRRREQ